MRQDSGNSNAGSHQEAAPDAQFFRASRRFSCILVQQRRFSENDRSVGLPARRPGLRRRASRTLSLRRLSGSSARLRGVRRLLDLKLEKTRVFKRFGVFRHLPYRRDSAGLEAVFLDAGVRLRERTGEPMIGTRPTIHVTFGSRFPFIPREFQVDCNPIWNTDTQLRIQACEVSCARSSRVGTGLALSFLGTPPPRWGGWRTRRRSK